MVGTAFEVAFDHGVYTERSPVVEHNLIRLVSESLFDGRCVNSAIENGEHVDVRPRRVCLTGNASEEYEPLDCGEVTGFDSLDEILDGGLVWKRRGSRATRSPSRRLNTVGSATPLLQSDGDPPVTRRVNTPTRSVRLASTLRRFICNHREVPALRLAVIASTPQGVRL